MSLKLEMKLKFVCAKAGNAAAATNETEVCEVVVPQFKIGKFVR